MKIMTWTPWLFQRRSTPGPWWPLHPCRWPRGRRGDVLHRAGRWFGPVIDYIRYGFPYIMYVYCTCNTAWDNIWLKVGCIIYRTVGLVLFSDRENRQKRFYAHSTSTFNKKEILKIGKKIWGTLYDTIRSEKLKKGIFQMLQLKVHV